MNNATEIRDAFWNTFCVEGKPREYYGKHGSQLPREVQLSFADFVRYLVSGGTISESLARVATL